MRYLTAVLGAAALSLTSGCTHVNEAALCPEYRGLRCATAPECSMDHARGCSVCGCSPGAAMDAMGKLPSGVAPDRRVPQQ